MTGNGTACPGHIDILKFYFFLYSLSYQLNIFLIDAGMSDKDLIPADLPIFLKFVFYIKGQYFFRDPLYFFPTSMEPS